MATRKELVELLADQKRRKVLEYLDNQDKRVSFDELRQHLAETLDMTLSGVKIHLYHQQLPKIADASLITYFSDQNIAAPTDVTRAAVAQSKY